MASSSPARKEFLGRRVLRSLRIRWPRTELGRWAIALLVWLALAAVFLREFAFSWSSSTFLTDTLTPLTYPSLRGFATPQGGPWNPWVLGGSYNVFYTNTALGLVAENVLSTLAGSLGGGTVLLLGAVQVADALGAFAGCRILGVRPRWALVGSFAYAASPWAFDRTLSGHELILLAGAFVPPLLALMARGLEQRLSWRDGLLAGIALGAIGLLEYHVFYLAVLVWGLGFATFCALEPVRWLRAPRARSVVRPPLARAKAALGRVGPWITIPSVAALLGSSWILPTMVISGQTQGYGVGAATINNVLGYSQLRATSLNLLTGLSYVTPFYSKSFVGPVQAWLLWIQLALVALLVAVCATALLIRRIAPAFVLLVAMVFLLLAGGTVVLGAGYEALVQSFPLFGIIDDPNKAYQITSAGEALLIGVALQRWTTPRVRSVEAPTGGGRARRWSLGREAWAPAPALAVCAILAFSAAPWFTGDLAGLAPRAPNPGIESDLGWLERNLPPEGAVAIFPPSPSYPIAHSLEVTPNPVVDTPVGNVIYVNDPTGLEALPPVDRMADWAYRSIYANTTEFGPSLLGLMGATTWDVNLQFPAPPDPQLGWANAIAGVPAISVQKGLGPGTAVGPFELYSPPGVASPPISLRSQGVLALGDREIMLDAGYLPGGASWLKNTSLFFGIGNRSEAGTGSYLLQTPEGLVQAVFDSLPEGQVRSIAPLAWEGLGTTPYDLWKTGQWLPWEADLELEQGRPLGAMTDYAFSRGGVRLQVPLAAPLVNGSDLWVDMFFGPAEGMLQVGLDPGPSINVSAYRPVAEGFRWVDLGPLNNATEVSLAHLGTGVSTVAAVATASPEQLGLAALVLRATLGATQPSGEIYWMKGEGANLTPTSAAQFPTGAESAQGWGTALYTGGSISNTFFAPSSERLTAWANVTGSGRMSIGVCPQSDPLLAVVAVGSCEWAPTAIPTAGADPHYEETLPSIGPGWFRVAVAAVSGELVVDQAVLAAPSSGSCATVAPFAFECPPPAVLPSGLSGLPTSDELRGSFPQGDPAGFIVHLGGFGGGWVLNSGHLSVAAIETDGWATAFRVPAGVASWTISLTDLSTSQTVGLVASSTVAVVVSVLLIDLELRRRGRTTLFRLTQRRMRTPVAP